MMSLFPFWTRTVYIFNGGTIENVTMTIEIATVYIYFLLSNKNVSHYSELVIITELIIII